MTLRLKHRLVQRRTSPNKDKYVMNARNLAPIGIEKLAEHMLKHGTIYTYDVLVGVMAKAVECIREMALDGQPVVLPNLCIVKAQVTSEGFDNEGLLTTQKTAFPSIRLTFRATGKSRAAYVREEANLVLDAMAENARRVYLEAHPVKSSTSGSNDGGGTATGGGGTTGGGGDDTPGVNEP